MKSRTIDAAKRNPSETGRLGPLTPEQEEGLEALTRGLIAKIAHAPIAELRKQAGEPNGLQVADLIRRIFRLEE